MMLVDRGVVRGGDPNMAIVGSGAGDGFLVGDDFTIGRMGETWVIDRIRTWVAGNPGAKFQKIEFLGGLANDQDTVQCACHNLIPLKTALLSEQGSSNPDIVISPDGEPDRWRVEFQNFGWSVPGGVKIQFALEALPRLNSPRDAAAKLLVAAVPASGQHALRSFTREGAFKAFLHQSAAGSDSLALGIQVWGHPSKIEPQGHL